MHTKLILLGCSILLALAPGLARAAPVTVSEGAAGAVDGQGTGLCAASAVSTDFNMDFGTNNPANYTTAINAFIDAHTADRVESVIRTVLDLSNNNSAGLQTSYGDFIDAVLPDCKTGGCDFFVNDTTTAFASRLRGFFNVTPELANKPIHFGIYADDAVSLTIYDKTLAEHRVVVRPFTIGAPAWRLTNQVTFSTPGLYPIEILYAELTEHAAFEMSYFVGTFQDFERMANTVPIVQLHHAGFQLFAPTSFFQTESGAPSFPDLATCKQCERQFVNMPGNNGCDAGQHCNEAALCAPCDTDRFCGSTCSPCGADTPFCMNLNGNVQCAGCRTDADCASGSTCDPDTKSCQGSPAGAGGAGGSGSGGSGDDDGGSQSGCDCRAQPSSAHAGSASILGIAIAVMGFARARRRSSRRSSPPHSHT
jgi:outer membrane exchange protein TraA